MSRLGVGDAKEKNEGKGSHGQDLASTLSKIPAAEGFEEVTGSDLCLESCSGCGEGKRLRGHEQKQGTGRSLCTGQAGGSARTEVVGVGTRQ